MSYNELPDSRQSPSTSGQTPAYTGNYQRVAPTSIPLSRSNIGGCPTDENQSPNPKNAQATPKIHPSVCSMQIDEIAEKTGEGISYVSQPLDELSEIIHAWPKLSIDIRLGIIAMIRATFSKVD